MENYIRKYYIPLGGLTNFGLSDDEKYILIFTHQGCGVIELETGNKIARAVDYMYPEMDIVEGVGPLENQKTRIFPYDFINNLIVFSNDKRYKLIGESSGIDVKKISK